MYNVEREVDITNKHMQSAIYFFDPRERVET